MPNASSYLINQTLDHILNTAPDLLYYRVGDYLVVPVDSHEYIQTWLKDPGPDGHEWLAKISFRANPEQVDSPATTYLR